MWRVTTILPRKGTGTGTGRAMLMSRLQQQQRHNYNINSDVMQVKRTVQVQVASRRSVSSSSSSNCGFLINNNTFTQSSSSSSFPFRNDRLRYFSVTTTSNNNGNNNNNNGKSNSNTNISSASIAAEPMDPDDVYNDVDAYGFNDDGYDDDDDDDADYDFKNTIADDVLKSAEKEKEDEERERYRLQQEVVNAELDQRTGRPWKDPWEITDEQWSATDTNSETALVDWSPEYVSRISLERLRIFHNKNTGGGIPTLKELSELKLQPEEERGRYSATLHPARDTKKYAAYRKSSYYQSVSNIVQQVASTRVNKLLQEASAIASTTTGENNEEWNNTHLQDQVDILFEEVQEEMKEQATMDILSKHPDFHDWVGRALEEYLRSSMKKVQAQQQLLQVLDEAKALAAAEATAAVTAKEEEGDNISSGTDTDKNSADTNDGGGEGTEEEVVPAVPATGGPVVPEVPAVPMFMDCYTATDNNSGGGGYDDKESTTSNPMVPTILHPLSSNTNGNGTIGRMVEEWELSASDVNKRILMRECTQQIATHLLSNDTENRAGTPGGKRIYLHGKRGIGKSSVLASIVASCRTSTKSEEEGDDSNYIVMYLPDGDRLSKNGFFIVPNTHRKDCFDLPDLSQQAIQQLLVNHATDLRNLDIHVDTKRLHQFFKESQLKALYEYCGGTSNNDENNESDDSTNDDSTNDDSTSSSSSSIPLMDIMNYSQEKKLHAPMCYSVMMDVLMKLKKKNTQFVVVMDEYNCLYDHKGHYYHMAYDDSVQTTIPCRQINLFEPIMNYMNLTVNEDEDNDDVDNDDQEENRITASVIVGTTESHAIRRTVTDALTTCAEEKTKTPNFLCVEIPRFTSAEVDHIIANYEATGVGKLRLDRGTTLMNAQEMAYLKMCSGSIGQRLLDVSIC